MTPFAKFTLFAIGASAAYYAVTGYVPQDKEALSKRLAVAGWDQLDACAPLRSLDGKREISLSEDHTLKLRGVNGATGDKATGVWAFDEASKRYIITLAGQQTSYTLVRPQDSEVCILARGELASSNMGESWYSRTLSDMQDDIGDADQ